MNSQLHQLLLILLIYILFVVSGLAVGRGMNTADELSLSPASDCNSNNVETSYASNTSELEFIQDNSDYQWYAIIYNFVHILVFVWSLNELNGYGTPSEELVLLAIIPWTIRVFYVLSTPV